MNHAPKIPLTETKPIKNIVEAVSHLLMPDLGGLIQLSVEMRESLAADKTALLRRKEDIRIEGYAAAMRLMLPDQDAQCQMTNTYFQRLNR